MMREDFDGRPTEVEVVKTRAFGKKLGDSLWQKFDIVIDTNISFETLGIFFTEGPFWLEQRRFTLRHMRDFGFGRRQDKFESHMLEEVSLLIEMLKDGPINDQEKVL